MRVYQTPILLAVLILMLLMFIVSRNDTLLSLVYKPVEGFQTTGMCPPGFRFFNDKDGESFCCGGLVDPLKNVCLAKGVQAMCSHRPGVKDPRSDASIGIGGPEVYAVNGSYSTKTQAEQVCKRFGSRLASNSELMDAWRKGADWCVSGWLRDTNIPKFPINTSLRRGCALQPSVVSSMPSNKKASAICYGPKPKQGTANILPFHRSKWSYNPVQGSAKPILPLCSDMIQTAQRANKNQYCPPSLPNYASSGKCCRSGTDFDGIQCNATDASDTSRYCIVHGNVKPGEQRCSQLRMFEGATCPSGLQKIQYTMGTKEVAKYGPVANKMNIPVCFGMEHSCIPNNVIHDLQSEHGVFQDKNVENWKYSCDVWKKIYVDRDTTGTGQMDTSYVGA